MSNDIYRPRYVFHKYQTEGLPTYQKWDNSLEKFWKKMLIRENSIHKTDTGDMRTVLIRLLLNLTLIKTRLLKKTIRGLGNPSVLYSSLAFEPGAKTGPIGSEVHIGGIFKVNQHPKTTEITLCWSLIFSLAFSLSHFNGFYEYLLSKLQHTSSASSHWLDWYRRISIERKWGQILFVTLIWYWTLWKICFWWSVFSYWEILRRIRFLFDWKSSFLFIDDLLKE